MAYVQSTLGCRGVLDVVGAGGHSDIRNSPEVVSRVRRVTGRKTLQGRPCIQLAASGSRYLAGRHHDGCSIRYLRMPLVFVPPVLKGKCDAGQADSHKDDDEDAPYDMRCKLQYLALIYW